MNYARSWKQEQRRKREETAFFVMSRVILASSIGLAIAAILIN